MCNALTILKRGALQSLSNSPALHWAIRALLSLHSTEAEISLTSESIQSHSHSIPITIIDNSCSCARIISVPNTHFPKFRLIYTKLYTFCVHSIPVLAMHKKTLLCKFGYWGESQDRGQALEKRGDEFADNSRHVSKLCYFSVAFAGQTIIFW